MAGTPPMQGPGAQPLNAASGQALIQAMKTQSPAPNPATPNERRDPVAVSYLDQNRIRKALDRAIEDLMPGDPVEELYSTMKAAIGRLLAGVELPLVKEAMLKTLLPPAMPGAGLGGPPQAPAPAGPGAPPMGAPPQGGPPPMAGGPPGMGAPVQSLGA